jgi:pyruvate dehydrogenase E2 component (dihydrolipoamide acetyltransferase)
VTLVAQEIPKIGLVMEEVTLVRWLKNVGDSVVAGEPLLEVETEKSVVEIEAAATGRLTQILMQVDSQALVGDQVAWIESTEAPSAAESETAPAAAPRAARPEAGAPSPPIAAQLSSAGASTARGHERILSTPVARKLAAERGIELGGITGSGPGGRVQLDDVQRVIDAPRGAEAPGAEAPGAEALGAEVPGPEVPGPEVPGAGTPRRAGSAAQVLSPMRRALARAMSLSNATVPQFTVSRAVEWTLLQARRRDFSAGLPKGAAKLSVTDFLLQAVARTLMEFPALNATFSGDPESADARVVPASGAHIGLVVAVDNGLLVPVMHDVEHLGLAEIARSREDCVERALKGRLKRDEVDGATFSISNLGAEGPDRFTAIINPPQSAILAVGRQRDCVVAREGAVVVRPMSDLTMTVDHRVADGRLAAQFLARLVAILEGRDWRMG